MQYRTSTSLNKLVFSLIVRNLANILPPEKSFFFEMKRAVEVSISSCTVHLQPEAAYFDLSRYMYIRASDMYAFTLFYRLLKALSFL